VNLTTAAADGYASLSGLKLRGWPGEETIAVFTPGSVKTHLISALAGEVLLLTAQKPMTAAALAAALLSDADEPSAANPSLMTPAAPLSAEDEQALEAVRTLVDGLVQAGLLLRQPCP
jgi:hypothetical protein